MRLTAKAIHEVQFRETSRGSKGYHQREVDEFLDQAEADYNGFEGELAAANQRVKDAEAALEEARARAGAGPAEGSPGDESTDELRRTLILAQRTADAAIREAREEAARLVSEAEARSSRQLSEADAEAQRLVTDADGRARQLVSDAEHDANQRRGEAHNRLSSEIQALEGTREELRAEMNLLDRHVEEQRQQLRNSLAGLQQLLDDPQQFRLAPAPPPRDITVPSLEDRPAAQPASPDASEPTPAAEPEAAEPEAGEDPETDPWAPSAPSEGLAGGGPADRSEAAPQSGEAPARNGHPGESEGAGSGSSQWESVRSEDAEPVVDLSAKASSSGSEDSGADGGSPTQAVPELVGDADEDAFLAELRKAMTDDEPLGPRDQAFDPAGARAWSEEPSRSRPRFGRRR